MLREEDVEILANLWLSEILYAVYNTPREHPCAALRISR